MYHWRAKFDLEQATIIKLEVNRVPFSSVQLQATMGWLEGKQSTVSLYA